MLQLLLTLNSIEDFRWYLPDETRGRVADPEPLLTSS
jgi:hypothetical protein